MRTSEPRSSKKVSNNGIIDRYGVLTSDGINGGRMALKQVIRTITMHIYPPCRMGVHVSNNPVYWKYTEDSNPVERQYTGVAVTYMQV